MTTFLRTRALAQSLSHPLVALYLAYLAAWSMAALHAGACTAPWWPPSALPIVAAGLSPILVGLWFVRAARQEPLVFRGGWLAQALAGALLAAGLAGALMSAGCGWLEAHFAPADTFGQFARAFGISLWQTRGDALQWAGALGMLVLHLSTWRSRR